MAKIEREPAIRRIVNHHGGPVALSQKLGGRPTYQQIGQWLERGWASPKHFLRLVPLGKGCKVGMTDLYADIDAAKAIEAEA